jgi:hypothetical protein
VLVEEDLELLLHHVAEANDPAIPGLVTRTGDVARPARDRQEPVVDL